MVDYSLPLYQHAPEVWDAKKCAKLANRRGTDGYGTKYPFKGYLVGLQSGPIHYNGGCCHDGKWWQGEYFPLPILAEGYEIVYRSTWGFQIRKVTPDSKQSPS